jgi:hypothetical protein
MDKENELVFYPIEFFPDELFEFKQNVHLIIRKEWW